MSRTISAPRVGKRLLALLLSAGVGLGLMPQTAFAAQTGSSGTDRTVFDALGFSTGAPEGYEQEESITDTPFGKTYAALSEVKELFVVNTNDNHKDGKDDKDPAKSAAYLYGHKKAAGGSISDFFKENNKVDSALSGDAILTAEGNFSANNNGRKKNVAVLSYQTSSSGTDYLRMRAGDADSRKFSGGLNGSGGSGAHWLLSGSSFGNADDKDSDNRFSLSAPYLAYNYLDLAVGDFDGDGIDEIAYYAGMSTPVVDVWKLQKTDGESYMTSSNWKRAWRYNLPKTDGLIPNMVSLAAADIDKDGIDDLAISYGYYKYGGAAQASKAVVLMGADNSQMMTRTYDIPLNNVYRAGLTAGDIDNDGRNELIVGGSADTKNRDARYLAIYGWNGKGFDRLAAQNVNPTNGSSGLSEKYYMSLPYMAASLTVGKFYGLGDGPCIYMDSIILRYGSGGIETLDLADKGTNYFYGTDFEGVNDHLFYVEWNAQAADLTGSGQEVVGVNRTPIWVNGYDLDNGRDNDHMFAYTAASLDTFEKQYLSILSFGGSGQSRTVTNVCSQWSGNSWKNVSGLYQSSDAVAFCLPNTDNNDTISLRYTGEHYYTYADPEVLAVLASPPYFADLANDDDDSQMIESNTSYSSSHGSGSGSGYSNSFSVGAYTSWEHTFSIFGVELFSAEAEASINNTFTWETQKSSSVEYEVSYATMAGMDSVVLYALPIETYIYEATMPDGTTQMMTVNLPYQPTVRTISAADYAEVQKVYSDILPDVTKMLTHTIGDPASYAPSVSALPDGRTQTLVYDGSFVTVGQGSQNTTSQSISMTEETENSFSYDLDIETKAGVGVGGVTVGITAGYSHGAGSVHITTAGSTYSGELNGLPTQAQRYGYSFDWKLVGCLYQGRYPFVTYLVNNVIAPPLLPENFGTNEDETTTDQIALEWDYPGNAAGFVIYRYLQSPSDSGYYKIGTVAGGDYISAEDGVKHYQFIDKGLSANMGYQYRIQTIGLSQPNESIPSEAYSTYTKPDSGVPQVGVSTERLATYPDTKSGVTAYIENSDEFTDSLIFHQWQKQTARGWEDVEGEKAASLTFQYPDMGVEGVYRCKVSAMVGQSLVTAYSPEVTVTFAQRASQIASLTIDGSTLTAVVKGSGAAVRPTGTVNFILTSANAETVYTAQLDETGTARVAISPAADLYKLTATYSGSKIFLPASYEGEPLFYTNGVAHGSSYVDVKDSYVYGDALTFDKYTVNADGSFDKKSFTPGKWDSIPDQRGADRFAAGRAGWIGKAKFTDGGKTYTVNIVPREVEVVGLTDYSFAAGSGSAADMLDNVTIRGLVEDWANDDGYVMTDKGYFLAIDLRVTNSAGESFGIYHYPSTPGAYTARMEKESKDINVNYTLICPTARLIITGQTYPLSAAVADGQETYGTVSVTYPKDALTAAVGQTVVFAAVPKPGYAVKTWYTADKDNALTEIADSAGKDTLTMTQTKDGLKVVVEFQKKNNTLTVSAQPDGAGKVTTEDKLFHNGHAYTADYEFVFTPEPTDGWHFTGWEYRVSGQTPRYSEDDSFTVKMPDSSVQLIARFERDTYKLTLGDHLTAYDENGNEIADLTAIPGDTKITVKPENGFHLSEGAEWTLEGAEKDDASTEDALVFVLTQDASVSAAVEAGKFSVALDMENVTSGTAAVSASGELEAGTKVTFSASPARGYAFEGWKNGDAIVSTSAEYTVTVSGALTLTPSFAPQQGKAVTLGEKIAWAITRGGEAVETDEPTLYPGESITLTAQPRDGDMVESWTVNGAPAASTAKTLTYTYAELESANDIAVAFKPVTYFTVHFGAAIAAAADGTAIADGDEVAAGSRMVFTYNGDGYVEQWKNGEDVIGGAANPLVIDPLTDNLNVTVAAGERAVFTVTDENTPEHYTAVLTGAYEAAGGNVEGSDVTITVTPEDGWRITDVTCGEVDFAEENGVWTGRIEGIDENMTYAVAVEEITAPPAQKFTITFDPTGGTLTGGTTAETGEDGRLSALPTPTRSGYTFGGWFTEAEGGEQVSVSRTYTENTTLYAHWTKNTTPSGGGSGGGGGGGGISAPSTNPVTPSQPENGTVSADKKTAAKGDTVTITVTPDEGYQVDQITVTDKNGKTIAVKDLGNGRYRFTMPDSAVTITPTFVQAGGISAKTFVDVAESAYYAKAVAWAVEHGVTDGTDADHFSPDAPCTRAQIVTFLWRAAGSPEPQSGSTFADVAENAYYAKAVAWATQRGITNGTSADTFSPDAPCTRAQGITFLWRAQNSPAAGGGARFADVDAGAYYAGAVAWAVERGVTNGTSANAFSPDAPCTRAQIVTFLWKTLA